MVDEISHKLQTRNLQIEDYEALRDICIRVYKGVDSPWQEEEISRLITKFPEGQI